VASKITERIESLEERVRQLKAKQQRIEARRRSLESRRTRREDTRRKILVGAVVLAKVDQGVLAESVLRRWLEGAVTRKLDQLTLAAVIQRDQLYRSALDEKARRPSSFVAEISSSLVNLAIGSAP
jgi:hypothetical protein